MRFPLHVLTLLSSVWPACATHVEPHVTRGPINFPNFTTGTAETKTSPANLAEHSLVAQIVSAPNAPLAPCVLHNMDHMPNFYQLPIHICHAHGGAQVEFESLIVDQQGLFVVVIRCKSTSVIEIITTKAHPHPGEHLSPNFRLR